MKWLDRLRLPPTQPLDELSSAVAKVNDPARHTFDAGEPIPKFLRERIQWNGPPLRLVDPSSPPPVGDAELERGVEAALQQEEPQTVPPITAADPSDAHRVLARAMLDELDRMEREALDAIKVEENRHRDAVSSEDERHAAAVESERSTSADRIAQIEAHLKDTRRKASGYNALFGSLEPIAPVDAGQGSLALTEPAAPVFSHSDGAHSQNVAAPDLPE
jgi:hypothetical protein